MRASILLVTICSLFHANAALAARLRDVTDLTPDTRIVYGSFDVYMGSELYTKSRATLYVLPANADKTLDYRVAKSGNGVFYWGLDPGTYLLVAFSMPFGGTLTSYIGAEFEVPESGSDIYIGSIEFRLGLEGERLTVEDQFGRVSAIYDEKFPERAGTSVGQTLQEPRVGNFASVHNPCDPEWGVKCENKRMGVTPLTPLVKKLPGIWPKADSLRPTFTWEPSESVGVTYDLIVYEAALTSIVYMKGRLTLYEEGLPEPRWQPEQPLAPGTRYYWSVRLRQGDRVTGWSTQGFFMFALFAWGSGSGQWFQFRTP